MEKKIVDGVVINYGSINESVLLKNPNYITMQESLIYHDAIMNDIPKSALERSIVDQRSPDWYNIKASKVSASMINKLLGFERKEIVDKFKLPPYYILPKSLSYDKNYLMGLIYKQKFPSNNPKSQVYMDFGTEHENNIIASVMQSNFMKDCLFVKTGFWYDNNPKLGPPWLGSSPDGIVIKGMNALNMLYDEDEDKMDISPRVKKKIFDKTKNTKRYVIELKTKCPFKYNKNTKKFVKKYQQSPEKIDILHIPQVAIQKLTSYTENSLMAYSSIIDYTRIFNLDIPEKYIQLLCILLNEIYNFCNNNNERLYATLDDILKSPEYNAMIDLTISIHNNSSIIESVPTILSTNDGKFII